MKDKIRARNSLVTLKNFVKALKLNAATDLIEKSLAMHIKCFIKKGNFVI